MKHSYFNKLLDILRPGARVFAHAGPSESLALRAALAAEPERAAGVEFVGVFLTSVNDFDYAGLHPTARMVSIPSSPRRQIARHSFSAPRTGRRSVSRFLAISAQPTPR